MHGLQGISMAGTALVQGTAQPAPQPRLVHAAHEFEAQLMKELLKPLEEGDTLTGDGGEDSSGSTGALGEFATETLGQALSEQGGLGIADDLIRTLSHNGTDIHGAKVTRNEHQNTRLSSPQ